MKQCCVLLCLILLLGCLNACQKEEGKTPTPSMDIVVDGGSTEPVDTTEPTSESTSEIPTESTTEATEGTELSLTAQVVLMARERENWLPAEEWYYQPYSYAVMDLNHNGRLELLVSSCQGTGLYTITDVYEVSADGEQLVRCETSVGEGASQVDLIVGKASAYYHEESGAYAYLFADSMRSGYAWNGVEYRAVSLTDGVVTEALVAGESHEWDEQGNGTSSYYNAAGEDIDETSYQSAVEDYFEGWTELEATFAWQNYSYEETAAMDEDAWVRALQMSYDGFGVN